MKSNTQTLKRFSEAAEPILKYIVKESSTTNVRFRCENTNISQIRNMAEGSAELLAQLLPV